MARIVEVTELALRDAHQSLFATRMALEDMIPACADIDQAVGPLRQVATGRDLVRRRHVLDEDLHTQGHQVRVR